VRLLQPCPSRNARSQSSESSIFFEDPVGLTGDIIPPEARDFGVVAVGLSFLVSGFNASDIVTHLFCLEALLRQLSVVVGIDDAVERLTLWLDDAIAQCVANPLRLR
jgi:hypothetical protein